MSDQPSSSSTPITSQDVRNAFIQYFESLNHSFVKPAPVLPQNDPTLLFINAGMNQFKDVFLGEGSRPYTRAVNSQPCIRVSGKHNDLEDVGRDTSHLTSFEMLGNWSFGDFYKKEIIGWAWKFLTDVYQLPKDKLYATVYETDDEAEALWKSETDVRHEHIYRCGKKDNFWEMGETGPCGPCSEIHIDLGPEGCDKQGEEHVCDVNGDCGRYLELWNLVFMQYNRNPDQSLSDLPAKHVDTGMGLERLLGYLNGTKSAYMTDLFQPLIQEVVRLTGQAYEDNLSGMPHRVMADHVRTVSFAISDNIMPSNEGRGYVLRRLIRRALRYSQKLGATEPILYKLVPILVQMMGDYLPQLKARQDLIAKLIQAEEESFLRTLSTGITRFEQVVAGLKAAGQTQVSGEDAFKLYDTYGFPVDLTEVMAEEEAFTVDMPGFEQALEAQKSQSRAAGKAHLKQQLSQTQSEEAAQNYPAVVHRGVYVDAPGGGEARLVYSPDDQIQMARHHTGTHLLHEALRHTLGEHVGQAGSNVDTDHLRFDFSHFNAVTKDQLADIEAQINAKIQEDLSIEIEHMTLDQAKALGAMATFGEKYNDDDVRVVKIGDYSTELCGGNHVYNTGVLEAVKVTAESAVSAGVRRIEAIAGHDNIAAYTQAQAAKIQERLAPRIDKYRQLRTAVAETSPEDPRVATLKSLSPEALLQVEADLVEASKQLEKKLAQLQNQKAGEETESVVKAIQTLANGTQVAQMHYTRYDLPTLRMISDNVINQAPEAIVVLLGEQDDTVSAIIRTPSSQGAETNAKALFKTLTQTAGGKGGGKDHMAQGGGMATDKISSAFAAIQAQLGA